MQDNKRKERRKGNVHGGAGNIFAGVSHRGGRSETQTKSKLANLKKWNVLKTEEGKGGGREEGVRIKKLNLPLIRADHRLKHADLTNTGVAKSGASWPAEKHNRAPGVRPVPTYLSPADAGRRPAFRSQSPDRYDVDGHVASAAAHKRGLLRI